MNFYIASRLGNYEQVRYLAGKLKAAGWTHTYDWTANELANETNIDTLKDIAQNEYNAVREADIVIVLTPQGRGTHTEFGMAIALDKKIFLCHTDSAYFLCDDNTSAFYWLPNVIRLIGNTDSIAREILLANGNAN